MPGFTCCVPGCYNNSHRDRELRFYTFPKDVTQRELWLKNISRAGVSGCFNTFQPTTGHRVCSVHFSGGRKTYNIRVPTQFPLRGVNERKHRRGRGRGKKGSAAVAAAQPRTAAHSGIVISNVYSTSPGDADSNTTAETGIDSLTVVQIDQNGEYVGSTSVAVQPYRIGVPADVSSTTEPTKEEQSPEEPLDYISVISNPLDHSYSLTTGTTSTELLRKLNEQRDIIALMEVKMKEMKATIRQLRVSEAKLQEEVRDRDRERSRCRGLHREEEDLIRWK
uniref:THAP domain-containing protein 11 n=1 Tax=Gadus morhua TaxID=8049 RepID=A0A8C5A6I7_GADMO